MRFYISLILIVLAGFFISFEFWGQTGNILFKIILLVLFVYLLNKHRTEEEQAEIQSQTGVADEEISEKPKVTPPTTKRISDEGTIFDVLNEPSLSINSFLVSQFDVLFNFFLPDNGYIFIQYNKDEIQLFHKQIKSTVNWNDSSQKPSFIKLLNNKETDILVENNLDNTSKILPFYDATTYSPGSILALATTISESQIIYWVFDSSAKGFFNENDLNVPLQVSFATQYVFTNALNQLATAKFLESEKESLKLSHNLNRASDLNELTTEFIDFLSELFEANKLTVAFLEEGKANTASVIKSIGLIDSAKPGLRFNLEEGLCGKVIANNQVYLLDDIEKDGYFIPRFSANEKTNYGLRSFLAIPLSVRGEVVGMISLEHTKPGVYKNTHKKRLLACSTHYLAALNRFYPEIKKGETEPTP